MPETAAQRARYAAGRRQRSAENRAIRAQGRRLAATGSGAGRTRLSREGGQLAAALSPRGRRLRDARNPLTQLANRGIRGGGAASTAARFGSAATSRSDRGRVTRALRGR